MADKPANPLDELLPLRPKEPTLAELVLSGRLPVQAEMKPYEPTTREQLAAKLQRGFEAMGTDRYKARQRAETILGGTSSNLPLNAGLVDIIPLTAAAMTPIYAEEGLHSLGSAYQAAKRGDYLQAGLEGVGGALGVLPGAAAAAKLARPVGDITARAIQAAPRVARSALEQALTPGPLPGSPEAQRGAIKLKGGNWLAGEVEGATEPLKQRGAWGSSPEEMLAEMRGRYTPEAIAAWGTTRQENIARGFKNLEGMSALNKWIDKKLNRYIKNEMATPEDPIRKLAEEGILHQEPLIGRVDELNAQMHRASAGQKSLAKSPLASTWEDFADAAIDPLPADVVATENMVAKNPWLAKLGPSDMVYTTRESVLKRGGFEHLIDELKNSIRPDSDLPAHLRWKPEDLEKVTVEQAVRRVHDINQYRAAKKAEANEVLARNPATFTHKEYPTVPGADKPNEKGLAWKEIKAPDMPTQLPEGWTMLDPKGGVMRAASPDGQRVLGDDLPNLIKNIYHRHPETPGSPKKALQEALKYEGDVMGHCVGGYCDDVLSGKTKIYSLRDKKGEPHVTIEVRPYPKHDSDFVYYELQDKLGRNPTQEEWDAALSAKPPEIIQIKGKGNLKPKDEYLPFVQDFVRSGNWERVGDLRNTGLITPDKVISLETRKKLEAQGVQIPKYMTEQEANELSKQAIRVSDIPPMDQSAGGMKSGGAVRMAEGGEVTIPDMTDGGKVIDGGEFKEGGKVKKKVNVSDNLDTMKLAITMNEGGSTRQKIAQAISSGVKSLIKPAEKASVLEGAKAAPLTAEERSVLEKFGQKQEQEAARAKKVEKQAQAEEPKREVKSKGKREKVEADYYRKMAEELGDEAVLKAARAGEHLKPTPSGYVGAPRTVTNPQALGAMRKSMDKDFADAVEAVRFADAARLGTWYDRAKQGIAESSELYQLPRVLEQHGVYSAGVSPESELGFALKHLNSRVAGQPGMAYRGAPMRTLDEAVAAGEPVEMGFKIGEYAKKNDPRIPNEGLFGVNDFRRAQGMGYTDPQGNPWKAGVSETMHPFMDAETALQVDRANKAGMGGRTDWAGPHIQEVPWVYGKAQDLYALSKEGRFKGDELEGIKSALQTANNTARDYFYKHAASATHEAVPGARLGHVPQVLDMSPAEKLEYGRTGRWDRPAPEAALNEYPEVGAGNRDIIYGAAGYRQLPSREGSGLYINSLGGVETNPLTIARPLMDYPTGGGGLMAPSSRKTADTLEQFRAFIDAQEAGAYNLPNTMAATKGKNSMVFDTRGRNPDKLGDPSAGVLPTSQQLSDINDAIMRHTPVGPDGTKNPQFTASATNRGVVVFPYDPSMSSKDANKFLNKVKKDIVQIYPSDVQKSMTTTGYVPGIGKRSPEGPLSTAPYSGEATGDLLRAFSELPPSVAMNISESEAIREAIREKALRDAKLGRTRGDIQESRRFFSEADWPKAVEMIRNGASVAAALSALGYSASSMAKDRE